MYLVTTMQWSCYLPRRQELPEGPQMPQRASDRGLSSSGETRAGVTSAPACSTLFTGLLQVNAMVQA